MRARSGPADHAGPMGPAYLPIDANHLYPRSANNHPGIAMNTSTPFATHAAKLAPMRRRGVPLTSAPESGDTPRAMPGTDDERRKKILADPKIHDAIRAVARLRGVPDADVDDVLHDVIEDACEDDNLPLDDVEQARLYLSGSSRHKAIDRARARKRDKERHVLPGANMPAIESVPLHEQTFARRLRAAGRTLFPRTYRWFERSAVDGESHASIAAQANVSPGHVRHEVSEIRRTLRNLGAVAVGVFLIAVGMRFWRGPGGALFDHEHQVSARRPQETAPELRERARQECANEEWAACWADLWKAASLDPAGETPELRELREKVGRKMHEHDATPGR